MILETDSQLGLNLINKSIPRCHPLSSLVNRCQGLLRRAWSIQTRHIYREANTAADFLASYAFHFDIGFHVLIDPLWV